MSDCLGERFVFSSVATDQLAAMRKEDFAALQTSTGRLVSVQNSSRFIKQQHRVVELVQQILSHPLLCIAVSKMHHVSQRLAEVVVELTEELQLGGADRLLPAVRDKGERKMHVADHDELGACHVPVTVRI